MESLRTMGREWAGPRIEKPHTGLRTGERFRRWRSRSISSGRSRRAAENGSRRQLRRPPYAHTPSGVLERPRPFGVLPQVDDEEGAAAAPGPSTFPVGPLLADPVQLAAPHLRAPSAQAGFARAEASESGESSRPPGRAEPWISVLPDGDRALRRDHRGEKR
jgi:hypothetical protein